MELNQVKKIVADAGIVGAGGAGFPTAFKLRDDGVDTLIINAAECEPLIYSDYFYMKKHMDKVLEGARIVMEGTKIKKCFLSMKKATAKKLHLEHGQIMAEGIEVYTVPDVYPMGDEVILIYEVLRRIVPPAGLPSQVGVIVQNVETLYNVANAKEGVPVTKKLVTIGGKVNKGHVIELPVGIPVAEVLKQLDITVPDDCIVIDGGPAMGMKIDPATAVVTKTTKSLLILPTYIPAMRSKVDDPNRMTNRASSTCCQCVRCTELCPRQLIGYPLYPSRTVRAVSANVTANPEDYLTSSLCCGCGVCELTSCCQGISPRTIMMQVKSEMAKNGIRYQHKGELKPDPDREYKMLPIGRFKRSIGVSEFDITPSDITQKEIKVSQIRMPLRQHIGKPAVACVKAGDVVRAGDLIAKADEGISANIHTSMAGTVAQVDSENIYINV